MHTKRILKNTKLGLFHVHREIINLWIRSIHMYNTSQACSINKNLGQTIKTIAAICLIFLKHLLIICLHPTKVQLWSSSIQHSVRENKKQLLHQTLLRQALPDSGDGGTKTTTHLRFVIVYIVVVRWSKYQFVILFTFWAICTTVYDY
jgi:hypothetical protein